MRIGTVNIDSKLALAPMAGVTDPAFRQICSELGAGYTVTELISSKALCYKDKKTETLLKPFDGEHPFNKIKHLPNVLLTPHMAWGGYETRVRLLGEIKENIISFYAGKSRCRVD